MMQKMVVKKEVAEQVTSKLQANKIEKSNPYPRAEHGHWGNKPDLKEMNNLKSFDLDKLKVCTKAEFKSYLRMLKNKDYQSIPNIIKLPNLNERLVKKMGLNNPACYITKGNFTHIRPSRKAAEGQLMTDDEYARIPEVVHNTNTIIWDKRDKNFFIPFEDKNDKTKINKIVFNKDKNGNLAVTVGKINKVNLEDSPYQLVGVGVAPTIYKSLFPKCLPTRLVASPTAHIITTNIKKSSKIKPDYDGKNVLHKSFDITVTDITENNKQKKLEQVEKALNAMYTNTPFVIKHIPADKESKNYGNITLRISNFDKSKIEKAVHKMAFSLDTTVKSSKGEAFTYKSQEELTDKFVSELTEKTKSVYDFIIGYFGLPEVRIVSKADLTYKGKVLYNPETGKPLTQAEWKKFVEALEKFLNRNYSSVGPKIVLSSQSLGRILERLSKTNSLEAIKKMPLGEMGYAHRTFDWISESSKNMQNVFGETVSRDVAARIEVACHSAAIRVQNVSDAMRNNIQQIIIDGVKNRESKAKISQKLFDKCVGMNRDFQMIADTEIQNNTNNAYVQEEVYNTKEGEKVYFKRFEMLDDNTCKKCQSLKGKVALFSETALPDENIKDPYAKYAIWEGKETGNAPMGTVHPYCRGGWFRYYPEVE